MSNPTNRPGSDEEWEALLHQLRLRAEAQPRPFFHARVQARLAAKSQLVGDWLPEWLRRPAYVALLGALGLAVSSDGAALRPPGAAGQLGTPAGQLAAPLPRPSTLASPGY